MGEKRYLIEVLLKARESISQVAQKAAKSLDEVTKSQDKLSESAKASAKATEQQRGALQQLYESRVREKKGLDELAAQTRAHAASMDRSAASYRARSREISASADATRRARDETVKLQTEQLNEARTLNELANATELQAGKVNKTVTGLRRQAAEQRKMANENRSLARSYDATIRDTERRAKAVENEAKASERSATAARKLSTQHSSAASTVASSIDRIVNRITRLDASTRKTEQSTSRLSTTLHRLGLGSAGAASNLRGLNAELQGFALAATIKYAQSLISAMTALGAQLFAVAAAAGQAAVGVGAALSAGMAQAIPVAGVLAAAFARLANILKVVKLQNQQQLTASHDAAAASRRQSDAADSIRAAEERVADAQRNAIQAERDLSRARSDAAREQVRAQKDVTDARKEAIRTVEDLIAAEEGASQSVESAQASLRAAIRSGDVAGAAEAELGVRTARTGLQRARQDAAPVRARGVEGVPAVADAEQRLADTRRANARQISAAERQVSDALRQVGRAEDDLSRTRRNTADTLAQETAAVDKLADSLKQLSPAERTLYNRILALQAVYKRASRPITDIIVRAFSDVVERITTLLQDPRILRGFRSIATRIAESIRSVMSEVGGERSVSTFQILSEEAVRNIPIATRIVVSLFRTLRNLVIDALPAFRLLLAYVESYADQAERGSRNSNGIRDFFVQGVRYANSFFKLGLAVIRLFLTLAGRGGAADEGRRTIDDLTKAVDGLTQKARDNAGKIRDFFASTHDAFFAILGVLATLGQAIISVFSPDSVSSFADFLNLIIIPAIANVVEIMGALVTVFHQFLALPGVAQVAQLVVTFLLLAKGLTVIRIAVLDIVEIIPTFLKAMGLMEAGATGLAITLTGGIALAVIAVAAAVVLLDRKFHFLGRTFDWLKGAATDVFEWLKTAAQDTIDWFSDVWNHGLLYWIRYPFIVAGKWLGDQHWFQWIIRAFENVIGWFAGPIWATLKSLIVVPFEAARLIIDTIWGVIESIVVIALDVLSGRFSRLGPHLSAIWSGIWDGIRGALVTALNSLIDLVNSAVDAINKISPFGDIGHIGRVADQAEDAHKRVADSSQAMGEQFDKVGNKSEENADRVAKSMASVAKSTEKASKDSAKAFDDLFKAASVSLKDIRQVTRIRMSQITADLGNKSAAGKEALAENFRQAAAAVKRKMDESGKVTRSGMQDIRRYLEQEMKVYGLSIRQARTILTNTQGNETYGALAGGGNEGRAQQAMGRATGGIASPFAAGSGDDHILVSPQGRPVAAMSGTEGIVNRPQMGIVNYALGGMTQMGLLPRKFGSLSGLWSSGMRHYATGGKLQLPASPSGPFHDTAGLPGYPAKDVFARPGTPVGAPVGGRIAKLSGQAGGPGGGGAYGYSIYINGSNGKSYFLTHFGSRTVHVGQRIARGQIIGTVADYPGAVPDHIHEGVHGGLTAITPGGGPAGRAAAVAHLRSPGVRGGGAIGRIAARVLAMATARANQLLDAAGSTTGGTDPSGTYVGASLTNGAAGRQIFNYFKSAGFTDAQAAAWVGNFQQESGLSPSAIQQGGPGRGLAQWGGGRFDALQAFAKQRKKPWQDMKTQLDFVMYELNSSESAAYRGIKAARTIEDAVNAVGRLYERFGIQGDRSGPARAAYNAYAGRRGYSVGGAVPGYGGGDTHPIWAEGGEHVWSKEEVSKAGGHGAMYAMRKMLGGGRSANGNGYQVGGAVRETTVLTSIGRITNPNWLARSIAPALEAINDVVQEIAESLDRVARKTLRRSKNMALRITRAFALMTEDGGTLDQIRTSVEEIATRAAVRIQRRQFRIGRNGPVRTNITDTQIAQNNLQTLQATRQGLDDERDSIQSGIRAATGALREANRSKNKKAIAAATAALTNLRTRLRDSTSALAQNAQDQVEAVESFQEGLLAQVNDTADRANGSLDRWQRVARAMGIQFNPNRILDIQMDTMRQQISGLRGVLSQALKTGNVDLAKRTRDQIDELNVQIAEAVAQQFQNSIDAVNNEAQRQTTRIDRAARRAQAGGVDYGAVQATLLDRNSVLSNQRAGLQALMNQAAGAGNIDQFNALADSIDELDTTILENTYAIRDNTDAAFNARTEDINNQFGFSSGVFTGAQGFFQAITERTGIDTLTQQLASLQGIATSLSTQQQGLTAQLSALTGQDAAGLTGTDLVNYLLSISTGPAFSAIMATLDPTQQTAFKDLVSGLLANATAVEQNTKAIGDLTGSNAQSFTSSFWSSFRTAVYNGAGGLLPQYQTLVPGAAIGARVLAGGGLMVHAGETIRPASLNRDWGSDSAGDVYNLNLSTPTQVLDPVDVNRQLAFLRKTSGR